MSYMLSLSEQTKLNAFLSGILDDYKTGVITQIQAVVESVTCFLLWKVETQKR